MQHRLCLLLGVAPRRSRTLRLQHSPHACPALSLVTQMWSTLCAPGQDFPLMHKKKKTPSVLSLCIGTNSVK